MLKCLVVHRQDLNNVGDMASNPLQYYMSDDEYRVIDITKLPTEFYDSNLPIVVGGGGLISNEFFGELVRDVLHSSDKNQLLNLWNQRWEVTNPNNKSINDEFIEKYKDLIKEYIDKLDQFRSPRFFWGAGYNGEYNRKIKANFEWPDWMVEFDKIGVRDWGQSLPWTPCASCMHPALRKKYKVTNDVIFFEHKKQLLKDFGSDSIPRFINSGSNVEQTIELLGSSNIILTNSYHGAYWGTLLKKKVIVVGAWGAKFYAMRHSPHILDKNEHWTAAVDSATIYEDAIDECINATERYWRDVKSLI